MVDCFGTQWYAGDGAAAILLAGLDLLGGVGTLFPGFGSGCGDGDLGFFSAGDFGEGSGFGQVVWPSCLALVWHLALHGWLWVVLWLGWANLIPLL